MPVHVFLNDDYADWELGYVLAELRSPAVDPRIEKKQYNICTFSLEGQGVTSMGGLRVMPEKSLSDVDPSAIEALILPGGTFWKRFESPALDALVARTLERNVLVAGICAATGYLARLGALDAAPHTSNSLAFLKERAPSYRGDAHYRATLAVRHDALITASGLGAVDFTREILDALEVYRPHVSEVWYRAFKHGEDPFAKRDKT